MNTLDADEHPIVIGIDGGGSTVRVAVVRDDLTILGESSDGTVNPGIIGRDAAAERIRASVQVAMHNAHVTSDEIAAVAIGVAGAAKEHSEEWLCEVLAPVLPASRIVPSNDLEIALVGARGERRGILILAGTGSAAYGVNEAGQSALVGGWGYLLGDEGSGYWLGLEALRTIAREDDNGQAASSLTATLLSALQLERPRDLVGWLYRAELPRNREIAALTPLIIQAAEDGETVAVHLIQQAATALARLGKAAAQRLDIKHPEYTFAGGLLETPSMLTQQLCDHLGLTEIPERRYPAVIGAALLALHHLHESR